ncbi:MAG: HIT family protein [Nanoarchaeota archaeon]|nr:HIT family protein [Nanoarchaeota archaeon]
MDDCIFCKIVKGEISCSKIYEDDSTFSFLDINPVNPGHTLIIPKRHYANFLEIPEKELENIIKTIKKIFPGILKSLNAPASNIVQSNGKDAGQDIPHIHFHLIPRYKGDNREIKWKTEKISSEDMQEIANKIKRELSKP